MEKKKLELLQKKKKSIHNFLDTMDFTCNFCLTFCKKFFIIKLSLFSLKIKEVGVWRQERGVLPWLSLPLCL